MWFRRAYDNLTTQTSDIPSELKDRLKEIQTQIPIELLREEHDEEGWVEGGLQKLFHLTILYGINPKEKEDIKEITDKYTGVTLQTDSLDYFDSDEEEGVVLILRCKSDDLERMHEELKESVKNKDSHPDYQPHITLAYLKEKLPELPAIESFEWMIDSIDISQKDGSIKKVVVKEEEIKGWFKKAAGVLYHVTHTDKVSAITSGGILPMQTSNWVKGTGERYGEGGYIYAMDSRKDAIRWAANMEWHHYTSTGEGLISVVEINDSGDWEEDTADPISQAGLEGTWYKKEGSVKPEDVIGSFPVTIEEVKSIIHKAGFSGWIKRAETNQRFNIDEMVGELVPTDVGETHSGDILIAFEGFTDDCWEDFKGRNISLEEVEQEIIGEWKEKYNKEPIETGWRGEGIVGEPDVFYAVFDNYKDIEANKSGWFKKAYDDPPEIVQRVLNSKELKNELKRWGVKDVGEFLKGIDFQDGDWAFTKASGPFPSTLYLPPTLYDMEFEEVLSGIIHELRHAFQVPSETWEDDITESLRTLVVQSLSAREYSLQPREIDSIVSEVRSGAIKPEELKKTYHFKEEDIRLVKELLAAADPQSVIGNNKGWFKKAYTLRGIEVDDKLLSDYVSHVRYMIGQMETNPSPEHIDYLENERVDLHSELRNDYYNKLEASGVEDFDKIADEFETWVDNYVEEMTGWSGYFKDVRTSNKSWFKKASDYGPARRVFPMGDKGMRFEKSLNVGEKPKEKKEKKADIQYHYPANYKYQRTEDPIGPVEAEGASYKGKIKENLYYVEDVGGLITERELKERGLEEGDNIKLYATKGEEGMFSPEENCFKGDGGGEKYPGEENVEKIAGVKQAAAPTMPKPTESAPEGFVWGWDGTSWIAVAKGTGTVMASNEGEVKEAHFPPGAELPTREESEWQDTLEGVSEAGFNMNEVEMGIEVEMEHTDDEYAALDIVLDNLKDNEMFYSNMEGSAKEAGEEDNKELEMGIEVEKEHTDTIKQIEEDAKAGNLKPLEEYLKMVAEDHIGEVSDYYTRLKVMEEEAKVKEGAAGFSSVKPEVGMKERLYEPNIEEIVNEKEGSEEKEASYASSVMSQIDRIMVEENGLEVIDEDLLWDILSDENNPALDELESIIAGDDKAAAGPLAQWLDKNEIGTRSPFKQEGSIVDVDDKTEQMREDTTVYSDVAKALPNRMNNSEGSNRGWFKKTAGLFTMKRIEELAGKAEQAKYEIYSIEYEDEEYGGFNEYMVIYKDGEIIEELSMDDMKKKYGPNWRDYYMGKIETREGMGACGPITPDNSTFRWYDEDVDKQKEASDEEQLFEIGERVITMMGDEGTIVGFDKNDKGEEIALVEKEGYDKPFGILPVNLMKSSSLKSKAAGLSINDKVQEYVNGKPKKTYTVVDKGTQSEPGAYMDEVVYTLEDEKGKTERVLELDMSNFKKASLKKADETEPNVLLTDEYLEKISPRVSTEDMERLKQAKTLSDTLNEERNKALDGAYQEHQGMKLEEIDGKIREVSDEINEILNSYKEEIWRKNMSNKKSWFKKVAGFFNYEWDSGSPWSVVESKEDGAKKIIRQEIDDEDLKIESDEEDKSKYKIGERVSLANTVVPGKGVVRAIDKQKGIYKVQNEADGLFYYLGEKDILKKNEGIF